MIKRACSGLALVAFMTVPSFAQDAPGDWNIGEYKTQNVEMAVATDKAGHKMHVLRLNGHVMAVVPAIPVWAMMRSSPDYMWQ